MILAANCAPVWLPAVALSPSAQVRPDHRAGVEFAAIDAHRAAEAAADLECRLDDGKKAQTVIRVYRDLYLTVNVVRGLAKNRDKAVATLEAKKFPEAIHPRQPAPQSHVFRTGRAAPRPQHRQVRVQCARSSILCEQTAKRSCSLVYVREKGDICDSKSRFRS
jgi:hypothetical protein